LTLDLFIGVFTVPHFMPLFPPYTWRY